MPNFKNNYDLFNTTGDNFNTKNVQCVNEDVWKTYMITEPKPDGNCYCRDCSRQYNNEIPECVKDVTRNEWDEANLDEKFNITKQAGCNFRVKLSKGPKEKNQYYIIQTLAIRNNPNSIVLRRAQLCWLYDNNVPMIIRATQNKYSKVTGMRGNGLVIHHKNGDHIDDRINNTFMIEHHEKIHAIKRNLENIIETISTSKEMFGGLISNKLSSTLELFDEFEDSSKVWKAIRINEMLINGVIDQDKCHDLMAEINMCESRVS